MLKLLKRWLGWDADAALFDFSVLRPRSDTRPTPPTPPAQTRGANAAQTRSSQPNGAPASKPKPKSRNPLDVLDNPRLTLDKPKDDGFDPYNTGAFNRSASWEKIGRQRKR